jgi:elongation factor Ts
MNNTTDVGVGMPYSIFSYVHHNGRIASLVTIRCKTDFALRTDLIKELGKKMAMQVVALGRFDPEDTWVVDNSYRVREVIDGAKKELGEPILIENVIISGK